MKKIVSYIMVLCLVFIVLAALGTGEKLPAKKIKVGTLMALTGDLREYGPAIQNGVTLAAKQLSEAGLKVELANADSETNPIAATDAARKLVDIDKVIAIVGALGSGVTMAVAESVTCPNNIILISPSSTSPVITDLPADRGKDYLFRTCPSDDLQGKIAGEMAAEMYDTVSIIYVDNSYGQGLAEAFKKTYEAAGKKVVASVPATQQAESYTAELSQLLAPKPDVLAAFTYPESAIIYLAEAIELHGYKSFLFCDGTKSEKIIEIIGAENIEGQYGTAPGSVGGDSLEFFNTAYKKEFGELPPLPFITNAYDATATIGLAAYLTSVQKKELTPENIRNNLRTIAGPPGEIVRPGEFAKAFKLLDEGKDIDYEGAAGAVNYDSNGDVVTPFDIWQYKGGKIVNVRTE
ncbi:MAG: ABC transporter substrate-binding protein [Spirochaetales bacterium]|nr:ABC transporter substrate-binding protein [Spirochaetales bacterium]